MNPYIIVLAIALGFTGGWKVQGWRYDANEKDRIEQAAKESARKADKVDNAAAAHEADKVRIRTVTKVITQEVERIVREPFYVDSGACLNDDGLRILSEAIGVAQPASIPASAVRGPEPAR